MTRHACRLLFATAAFLALMILGAGRAEAQGYTYPATNPDLFYNFYTQPSMVGGVPAQLYVSPRPVPPNVGHTYITYQPLMPHEFLYRHYRRYWRYHPGSGMTRARVLWF